MTGDGNPPQSQADDAAFWDDFNQHLDGAKVADPKPVPPPGPAIGNPSPTELLVARARPASAPPPAEVLGRIRQAKTPPRPTYTAEDLARIDAETARWDAYKARCGAEGRAWSREEFAKLEAESTQVDAVAEHKTERVLPATEKEGDHTGNGRESELVFIRSTHAPTAPAPTPGVAVLDRRQAFTLDALSIALTAPKASARQAVEKAARRLAQDIGDPASFFPGWCKLLWDTRRSRGDVQALAHDLAAAGLAEGPGRGGRRLYEAWRGLVPKRGEVAELWALAPAVRIERAAG